MSGAVRILAILAGPGLFAVLHFGLHVAWYFAAAAGIAIFWILPICHEKVADLRSARTLALIIKKAGDVKAAENRPNSRSLK
jgi:hypothetical protein